METEKIKEKIPSMIYKLVRRPIMRIQTYHLGRIEELPNRINCYVSEFHLNNHFKSSRFINNFGSLSLNELDLKKPVYYIFEGIKFNRALTLNSEGMINVVFHKCIFAKPIYIKWLYGSIIFKDNVYRKDSSYSNNTPFLKGKLIDKITLEQENFESLRSDFGNAYFGIELQAKEIEVKGTHINIKSPNSCYLESDKLLIENSMLRVNNLYIDANSIIYDNNYLKANDVCINNKNNDYINTRNMITSNLIINNEVINETPILEDSKDNKKVQELRERLVKDINELKNIRSLLSLDATSIELENTKKLIKKI